MRPYLSHLTLNTGNLVESRRNAPRRWSDAELRPIVEALGGPVPGLDGWHLDLLMPISPENKVRTGGIYFQIANQSGLSMCPVVMGIAAWTQETNEWAWKQALASYGKMHKPLENIKLWLDAPDDPPPLPWLAVWLTPFLLTASLPTMTLFGSLERDLAWTLIP